MFAFCSAERGCALFAAPRVVPSHPQLKGRDISSRQERDLTDREDDLSWAWEAEAEAGGAVLRLWTWPSGSFPGRVRALRALFHVCISYLCIRGVEIITLPAKRSTLGPYLQTDKEAWKSEATADWRL